MSRVGPERRRGCSRRRDHGHRRRRRGALDGRHPSSGLGTDHCVRRLDDPSPRSQPPSKAILQQDFVASLLLILIGIGSRGHLAGLRRSAGSGPIGSARRQIVSPGNLGPITDLRPRSSVVRAWGCGHTRSAHLGGAAAPSASGRASGEPTQRFPNGSFADPAHCVSRAPRLLAHRMMRSPIPRTDPSPSTRLVPT